MPLLHPRPQIARIYSIVNISHIMAVWRRRFLSSYVASLDLDISAAAAVHLIANVYYTLLFVLPRHLHGLLFLSCPSSDGFSIIFAHFAGGNMIFELCLSRKTLSLSKQNIDICISHLHMEEIIKIYK